VVRYTLLRFLIFFGCLGLLWLLGLRDRSEQPWLLVGAALLSMLISFFALRPLREDTVEKLSTRVESRIAAKRESSDEAVEDAATEADYR
jgi:hypothetical protein